MAAGEVLSGAERASLDAVIRKAEQLCRAEFSVFVGLSHDDPHQFATRLHNTLVAPSRSILVMVDPEVRALEVITGAHVRRHLAETQVELAVATMTRSFADGDLAEGLRRGILQLAEHARPPQTLHAQ